jgi:hypothetical protein
VHPLDAEAGAIFPPFRKKKHLIPFTCKHRTILNNTSSLHSSNKAKHRYITRRHIDG